MPRNPQALRQFVMAFCLGRRSEMIQIIDEATPWRGIREVAADIAIPPLVDMLMEYRHEALDVMEDVLAELRPQPAPEKTE